MLPRCRGVNKRVSNFLQLKRNSECWGGSPYKISSPQLTTRKVRSPTQQWTVSEVQALPGINEVTVVPHPNQDPSQDDTINVCS